MLSATLSLWDILWEVKVPLYREEPWMVELQHIRRAHRLMAILDGIREGFRTDTVQDATQGGDTAPVAAGGVDKDLPGCPLVKGTTTTEIARRMMCKAVPTGVPNEYKVCAVTAWKLFTKKEHAKVGKLTVYAFRDVAKACPAIIGEFDASIDALVFTIPGEQTDAGGSDRLVSRAHSAVRVACQTCTRPSPLAFATGRGAGMRLRSIAHPRSGPPPCPTLRRCRVTTCARPSGRQGGRGARFKRGASSNSSA